MFCIQNANAHGHQPNHSRFLHSFRSHKSLRAEAASQSVHHHRKPSDASSVARSSAESSRPSVEWDPLRLHPPMATEPTPALPPTTNNIHYHHQPKPLRPARSMHALRPSSSARAVVHSRSKPSVVIYGGFDFGFSMSPPSSNGPPSTHSHSSDSDIDEPLTPTTPTHHDPASAMTHGLTPRPHRAGLNGPDQFIKRGEWKRRGIVFGGAETAMASEDETFDLDPDFL